MTSAPPTALIELQAWPHWVVWRTEERDGKPTKVPYSVHARGRRASSTDPKTWGTYEQAEHARANGQGHGVGYVFSPDDEYTGVDLDKCIEPAEGAFAQALGPTVCETARRLVIELDSYTELSPTGTGLHIIVRGRVNGSRNRTSKTPWGGEFEFYDQARFFTITGQHLPGTPETIEPRQEELDTIRALLFPAVVVPAGNGFRAPAGSTPGMDDIALMEKIRSSKQGPKFAELFDRGAGDRGASEADLALCNILAFWTGPAETDIDRWFRRSALMRDKWDEKRGDTTYGGYTIARALENRTEFYGQKRTPTTPRFEGRAEAVADSRSEAARLLGLEDDRTVIGGRAWGHDLEARVEIDISDGSTLRLKSLNSYTQPAKINSEISFQIGSVPHLTQATIYELFRHFRLICDFQQAITVEIKARDAGISFVQEAPRIAAEMVNHQTERWAAMAQLAERDPVALAKASGKSIASESLVIDSNGTRYVRVSWFAAYARQYASPSVADQIVGRMVSLGWGQPGTEGRVKATQPNTGKTLQWAFFTVPEGWEEQ